jgi:AcrR family transcriptional regulator
MSGSGEVIAAAVRVFTADGYRAARMSDVAREAGLSEAAIYRYVDSREGLFVLAIERALLLEDIPADADFPLRPASLAQMIHQVRDFVAAAVPVDSLAAALRGAWHDAPLVELDTVMRELYGLGTRTRKAADMIERSARELPALADLLNTGLRRPALAALTEYLHAGSRPAGCAPRPTPRRPRGWCSRRSPGSRGTGTLTPTVP